MREGRLSCCEIAYIFRSQWLEYSTSEVVLLNPFTQTLCSTFNVQNICLPCNIACKQHMVTMKVICDYEKIIRNYVVLHSDQTSKNSECTNTYTHIHIIVMWQDKALTISFNFHILTPKKKSTCTTQKFWNEGKKQRKRETLTRGESNVSQTDRYLYS